MKSLSRISVDLLLAVVAAMLSTGAVCASGRGLVTLSAASLRSAPSHSAELETQLAFGTPVEIRDTVDGWLRVVAPDGYEAYVHPTAIARKTDEEMSRWRRSARVIVTAIHPTPIVRDTLCRPMGRNVVSDVTLCSIFEGVKPFGSEFVKIVMPDGRQGYLPSAEVENFESWSSKDGDAREIVDVAYSLMGTPYLWGGTTSKAVDCSGLTQLAYMAGGRILLPRNASAQARLEDGISRADTIFLRQGDLLFFSDDEAGRITHVAIYDREGRFVHSSGRVSAASFAPEDPLFIDRKVVSMARVLIHDGIAEGAVSINRHPLYFETSQP